MLGLLPSMNVFSNEHTLHYIKLRRQQVLKIVPERTEVIKLKCFQTLNRRVVIKQRSAKLCLTRGFF